MPQFINTPRKSPLIFVGLLLGVIALLFSHPAVAIPMNEVKTAATNAGLAGYDSFSQAIKVVLQALLALAFMISVIFMVISGYRFVTSQGNEEQVTTAKKNFYWAVIGIAVIVFAWIMVNFIVETVREGKVGNTGQAAVLQNQKVVI